jgi:hypothetical protein
MPHWCLCQCCAGILACIELASLQALRCHHCQLCTVVVASIDWRCCLPLAGIFALIVLASPPLLPPHWRQHCKLASAQPQRSHDTSTYVALLSWSFSLPVALLPYPVLFHGNFAFNGQTNAALTSLPALCLQHALASLSALCRCCCRHYAGIVALFALVSSPLLHLR